MKVSELHPEGFELVPRDPTARVAASWLISRVARRLPLLKAAPTPRPGSARWSDRCPTATAGSTSRSESDPCGLRRWSGASSMCWEPSRLVCPTFAVALAGRWTSPSIRIVTRACQSRTSIPVTLPTLTSATRTRVLLDGDHVRQFGLDRGSRRRRSGGPRQGSANSGPRHWQTRDTGPGRRRLAQP